MLATGAHTTFTHSISQQEWEEENEAEIAFGCHKSASDHPAELDLAIATEVLYGYALPLPASRAKTLFDLMIVTIDMARKSTFTNAGICAEKFRMTHDHSFEVLRLEQSFNLLADISCLPNMVFGWCLSRILHYVCSLRFHYPKVQIFISKYDYKAAYKRLTQNGITSARSSIIWRGFLHVALRLTSGGLASRPLWCTIMRQSATWRTTSLCPAGPQIS
jgi:hypothetical protein